MLFCITFFTRLLVKFLSNDSSMQIMFAPISAKPNCWSFYLGILLCNILSANKQLIPSESFHGISALTLTSAVPLNNQLFHFLMVLQTVEITSGKCFDNLFSALLCNFKIHLSCFGNVISRQFLNENSWSGQQVLTSQLRLNKFWDFITGRMFKLLLTMP